MKRIYTFITLTLFTAASLTAQSFIKTYSFDSVKTTTGSVDPTPLSSPTGTQFGTFTAKGVSVNPNATGRFSFTGWGTGATTGATLYSSLSGTLDTGKYYQVSVSPQVNYQLELDSISFLMQRSGTGVRTFSVRSSADKFTSNLPVTLHTPDTVLTVESGNVVFLNKDLTNFPAYCTINLGGGTFSGMGTGVTFRFYGFNSEGTSGTFSIDGVDFYGSSTLTTGIMEQNISSLQIVPVPSADGLFHLRTMGGGNVFQTGTNVQVYSVQGKLVFQAPVSGAMEQEIDLGAKANGVYFLVITDGKQTYTRRLSICR